MANVGIVVDDLAPAVAFVAELGLELEGEAAVEGRSVDRVVGLDGVPPDIAMTASQTATCPSGGGGEPGVAVNALGIRHVRCAVDGIEDVLDRQRAHGAEFVGELARYENSYRLCYVRGSEGSSSNWPSGLADRPARW